MTSSRSVCPPSHVITCTLKGPQSSISTSVHALEEKSHLSRLVGYLRSKIQDWRLLGGLCHDEESVKYRFILFAIGGHLPPHYGSCVTIFL